MFFSMKNFVRLSTCHRAYSAFSPEKLLNEENIRKTISKFARMQPIKTQPNRPTKKAAVLVPVCVIKEQVSLLYTLRAANLKSHRGQVSFPGGMEDASDGSAEQTALRETQEELGIKPEMIHIWGKGNVIVSGAGASVLPVVGFVDLRNIEKDLEVNRSEVKEVFTVPIEVLCNPKNIRHTQFRTNYSLPVFTGGKRKIWGLTAIMTHLFLRAFIPRESYDHSIKFIPPLRAYLPSKSQFV